MNEVPHETTLAKLNIWHVQQMLLNTLVPCLLSISDGCLMSKLIRKANLVWLKWRKLSRVMGDRNSPCTQNTKLTALFFVL